jgi:uncharacterized protein (TIGR02118 family)
MICKFVVVLYRKPSLSREQFRDYFLRVHEPLGLVLPNLRRCIQNFAQPDASRPDPGWDAVIELWWDSRAEMETAWQTAEGRAATADLGAFADLSRSTWSIVEERAALS